MAKRPCIGFQVYHRMHRSCIRLPDSPNTLPANASHTIGVGALVTNSEARLAKPTRATPPGLIMSVGNGWKRYGKGMKGYETCLTFIFGCLHRARYFSFEKNLDQPQNLECGRFLLVWLTLVRPDVTFLRLKLSCAVLWEWTI